jgi:protein-disulfide isomerase
MHRRRFVALGGSVALAGCLPGSGDGGDDSGSGDGGDGASGDGAETLETHAAGRDLAAQPRHGPAPGEATGTIVAFEDPSCPRCRTFEQEIVPQVRSELVDPGDATFVFRGYPVIYDWGEPAVRALEATYDADPAAHWTLASHYFDEQGSFSGADAATVYDRSETLLAEETDLDATAVIDAARNGDSDAAVEADLSAGMDAGAGGTTPHVFLFRDGVYQTKAAGSVSLEFIRSALQL